MNFTKLFTSKNKHVKRSTFLIISAAILLLSVNFSTTAQAPNVTYKAPIVIREGGVYSGNWESKDSRTPAVQIATDQPVTIQNSIIKGPGELIYGVDRNVNLTVKNTKGYGTKPTMDNKPKGRFVVLHTFKRAIIENNYMESTAGIYISEFVGNKSATETIKVRYNKAKNIDGRTRNGGRMRVTFCVLSHVNHVKNIDISWNEVINLPNQSAVEDNINMHKSSGTSDSYIAIHDNYIQGAYPTDLNAEGFSGGGINVADGSSTSLSEITSFVRAYNNHVVSTTNHGMAITAGNNNIIENNRIISCGYVVVNSQTIHLKAQNVGIAIYNMNKNPSNIYFNNGAKNNTIGWMDKWGYKGRGDIWIQGGYNTNNKILSGTVTRQMELDEHKLWLAKVATNNKQIGVIGATTSPPPVTEAPSSGTKRVEAEKYTELSDPGTNAIGVVKVTNHSGDASVKIFDTGDKIRLSFTGTTGQYIIKARVRSGYYNSKTADNDAYWPNGYGFLVNGTSVNFIGDKSTISAKDGAYGGSYWGTMNSGTVTLKSGTNTVDISAKATWLGVDYIEIVPASSSETSLSSAPQEITMPPASGQRIEAEKYKELADPGNNPIGTMKVANHSGDASVKILDVGDKIRISFTSTSGQYMIKARVRSGYYTSTSSNNDAYWPNGYAFLVNGSSVNFTGDKSTISGKDASYGGSYWGTMNSTSINLNSGTNTVDISAKASWLGVDYIEIVPTSSSQRMIADEENPEDESQIEFNVYPNPVTNLLTIEGDDLSEQTSISLWSSAGTPILKETTIDSFDKKAVIDLQRYNLQPGLYLLRVQSGSDLYERKIYKQ